LITQLAGNGRVLLTLNEGGEWTDLFFPHPGQFQHLRRMRLGLFDLDRPAFIWLQPGNGYLNPRQDAGPETFPSTTWADHGLTIRIEDIVHPNHDLIIRSVRFESDELRHLRLFSYQSFNIGESLYQETAYVDPTTSSLVHYKRGTYFEFFGNPPFDDAACGEHTLKGLKGTYVDAEDGKLEGRRIAHGAADSVMQWNVEVPANSTALVRIFVAIGHGLAAVHRMQEDVKNRGANRFEQESRIYWRGWVARHMPEREDGIGERTRALSRTSVLVLKFLTGANGSIIASPDTRSLVVGGDTYNYCWWRDGGYIAEAMDGAGLREDAGRFLRFAQGCQNPNGSFFHRHFPDGEIGSTWHPPPFLQIDQTATVVDAVATHLDRGAETDAILELWPMVKSAARFLADFRDSATDLPGGSFDLWEERFGIHAYSSTAVVHALESAARIGEVLGKEHPRWRQAAGEIHRAVLENFWDPELDRFIRSISPRDDRIDASILLALDLGLVEPSDPRFAETVATVEGRLWSKRVGGVARYEGDEYYGPENPWIIATAWLGAAHLKLGHVQRCRELIDWIVEHATPSGLLPEQLDSATGEPRSATPLAWSHATFLDLVDRYRRATEAEGGGSSAEQKRGPGSVTGRSAP
jgi:oligosaccharide amylase